MNNLLTFSTNAFFAQLALGSLAAVLTLALLADRAPYLVRIGLRNVGRRRLRTVLIVAGLMLSTTFVASSLAVDDTVTRAVQTVAIFNLGRIDEDVVGGRGDLHLYSSAIGGSVTQALTGNRLVAGVAPTLSLGDVLVADETSKQVRGAVTGLGMDASGAGSLGDLRDTAGAPAPNDTLAADDVYLNASLAQLLSAKPGDALLLYSSVWPGQRYPATVKAIVTGGPLGDSPALVAPLITLQSYARAEGQINHIYIANTGDGLSGVSNSDAVAQAVYQELPSQLRVDTVKQDGVQTALQAQEIFGRILTLYTLFALSIGLLLIFLIFTLLAAERRAELGMSRALGMRRSHVINMLLFEGTVYDAVAAGAGVLAGLGLGILLVVIVGPTIARIGFPLQVEIQPQSLVTAFCLGLLFTLATIWLAAWTVSRMTVSAALRDLPDPPSPALSLASILRALVLPQRRTRRLALRLAALRALLAGLTTRGLVPIAVGLALVSLGARRQNDVVFSLGLTSLIAGAALVLRWVALSLVGLALRVRGRSAGVRTLSRATLIADRATSVLIGGGLVLYWSLPFDALRNLGLPRFSGGIEVFFVAGVMMVFGAVWAIAPNLDLLLMPLRWLGAHIGRLAHVTRIATVYPAHHRFRTGINLALFSLVCFTMVVMACIAASATQGYDNLPAQSAQYDIAGQPLFSPVGGIAGIQSALRQNSSATASDLAAVSSATPLPLGIIQPSVSNARWSVYPASEIGGAFLEGEGLPLVGRAAGYASTADVWRAVRTVPGAVVIDADALSAGDAAVLGVPTGYRLHASQLIGAPIAAGIPGLSSVEALNSSPQSLGNLSVAGLSLNDGSLPEYQLRLRGIATGHGTIAPTTIWVTDIRGGPAKKLTIVGVVDSLSGKRTGLLGSAATFAPLEQGLAAFGNEYYYFAVKAGADPHAVARGLGSALSNYGFETTVLADVLLDVNGPSIFISQVLVGLVGLTLLVGMAALAVAGSRAVVERRQQIGMLRAIGFRRIHVQGVFLLEAFLVGIAGTAIGLVMGLVLSQNIFAVDFFERVRSGLTFTVPWHELAIICAASLGASLVAALVPAWQAGRITPSDALRYE